MTTGYSCIDISNSKDQKIIGRVYGNFTPNTTLEEVRSAVVKQLAERANNSDFVFMNKNGALVGKKQENYAALSVVANMDSALPKISVVVK